MLQILKQSTQVTITILMIDSSDHVTGKTGLSAGLTIYAAKAGGTPATITPTVAELDATNVKGVYSLVLTTTHTNTLGELQLHITGSGADPTDVWFQVVACDLADAVRLGLTALPNAAAEAAGGLYTRGTGAGQINQPANGNIDANVKTWLSGAIPAVNVTGVPKVDVVDWLGSAPNALSGGKVDAATVIRGATAQAGAAGTITLDASASATDDLYTGEAILIVSGTGASQCRRISAYVGSTKVATVSGNWATNPASDSVFIIVPWARVDIAQWIGTTPNALISGRVDANAQVVGDKTGYSLTQTFPTNFSSLSIDSSGRVTLVPSQIVIKKNIAKSNFAFLMTDATTHAPKTAVTVTATRRIDSGSFAACANAVTEIANGWYTIDLATTDLNGDVIAFRMTGTGADDLAFTVLTQP